MRIKERIIDMLSTNVKDVDKAMQLEVIIDVRDILQDIAITLQSIDQTLRQR